MASCFTSFKVGRGPRAAAPGIWSPGPNLMSQCRGLSPCLLPTPSSPFYLQPLTLLSQEEGRGWELGRGWPPPPALAGGGVPREAKRGGCGSPGRGGRGLNVNHIPSERVCVRTERVCESLPLQLLRAVAAALRPQPPTATGAQLGGCRPGWVRPAPRDLSCIYHLPGEDLCVRVSGAGLLEGGVCL